MDLNTANSKNFYELLGLEKEASTQEIRASYHELARVYHPDSNFYSEIVGEKVSSEQIELFKIITCAYHTLIDPKKRKEYDEQIAPAISAKIKEWDDQSETMSSSKTLTGTTSSKRVRAATFGQTGSRPYMASIRQELNKKNQVETSISEVIKRRGKIKTMTVVVASIGMLLGLTCSIAIIYFVNQKNSGRPASSYASANSVSIEGSAPKPIKNSIDD